MSFSSLSRSPRSTRLARTCLLALPAVVGLTAVACGSSSTRPGFDGPPADTTGTSGGTSGNTSGFIGGDSGVAVGADGCTDAARLVYVLSLEGDLYSFAPADKKFTKVGALNCTLGGKEFSTVSMAVDRDAVAWVNMRDQLSLTGESVMFKVDTKTAACTPTNIKGSWGGMGFSTNAGTTDKETLFMIGQGTGLGGSLLTVDFTAEKIVPVKLLPEQIDLELTGTGDGRLYGFLQSSPLAIAAVDKTSAVFSQKAPLPSVPLPQPPMFAFSFWGGDFYVYTATDTSAAQTSTVSRYRPSDHSIDNAYMTNIGFHIVGAGVSTCAPTAAPK
jgi:hypothetical protein